MIARDLMDHHGLKDWRLVFDRSKKRLGGCSNHIKTLTFSVPFIRRLGEEEFIETVLHEISHGLSPKRGHNLEWASICAKIGGTPSNRYRED